MTPEKALYIADYCLDNTQVREALKDMARQVEELQVDAERYRELIYSVGMKHQGETRHETAKRYIMTAETQSIYEQGKQNDTHIRSKEAT